MVSASTKSTPSTKQPKQQSSLVKSYLFLYNFILVLGWSYLLYQLATFYITKCDSNLWDVVKNTVFIFQNAAVLEIFHAATGMVKSNPVITTFQVLSRVMVVCGVVMATPTAQVSPGLPLALLAWSVTEIIRYGYYASNLVNVVPHILVWLRYTTFIILYPIGVTGELLCFYYAQSYVKQHKMWSVEMPNSQNFTFSYHYFLLFVMFLYIPLFPQMYLHMFAQRRKILGQTYEQVKSSKSKKST